MSCRSYTQLMACNNLNTSPTSVEQTDVAERVLASTKLPSSSQIHIPNHDTIPCGRERRVSIAFEIPSVGFFHHVSYCCCIIELVVVAPPAMHATHGDLHVPSL